LGWKIEYDRRALKELKKLDRQAQQQILDYFDERITPMQDPRQFGKPLSSSFSGL
jgi:mRNA interferase RelE/StbE